MQQGWIKLHRKIVESPVFDNPNLIKLWLWCLCKATHKKHEVVIGRQIVILQPGQFVFGRKKAAEALMMNDRTVYDYMQILLKLGMIQLKPNNKYTLVTIVNWEIYQGDDADNQQQNAQQNTIEDAQQSTIQMHTYNNGKNEEECIKKEKKHIYGAFRKVKLTDTEKERLILDFGADFVEECVRELDEYKEQTGKTYRNDNLAIRKWVVDAVKKKGVRKGAENREEQRADYEQISFGC